MNKSRKKSVREIERKFLVKSLPKNLKNFARAEIAQGYLASEGKGRQVRLRKRDAACSLTFKRGNGDVREEREISLTPRQFDEIWPGTTGRRLRKVRYHVPWEKWMIEVDVYRGALRGLIVAEVEFPNRRSCLRFEPPDWFGTEVTGKRRYSNVRLACE